MLHIATVCCMYSTVLADIHIVCGEGLYWRVCVVGWWGRGSRVTCWLPGQPGMPFELNFKVNTFVVDWFPTVVQLDGFKANTWDHHKMWRQGGADPDHHSIGEKTLVFRSYSFTTGGEIHIWCQEVQIESNRKVDIHVLVWGWVTCQSKEPQCQTVRKQIHEWQHLVAI